jgi:uncharacterized protein YfaS (alpha-2-macroglobulin family)
MGILLYCPDYERRGPMNKQYRRWIVIAVVLLLAFVVSRSIYLEAGKPLSVEVQSTGPQIVEQNPMEGQRLDLAGTIELTFDRDMDQVKTGEAFSLLADGGPVLGQVTWRDARTLVFTPEVRLRPATVYLAGFSAQAAGLDGTTLPESIQIEFKTVEALAVSQVFPAEGTENVSVDSSITVIFNHPVVPVTIVEEQEGLPQPLKFTPEVTGGGEWVNSSVYVFQPEQTLLSGTRYQVRMEAGLEDVSGNALGESFSWQFSTRAPVITNLALKDGPQNPEEEITGVPLDQSFIVSFSQAMDTESVEAAVRIVNRETLEPFPLNFKWDEGHSVLTADPKGKFRLAGYYELKIGDSAQAEDGGRIREGWTVQFATVPYPQITAVSPGPDDKGEAYYSSLTITFASPMKFESMKGRVLISPAIPGEPQWHYNTYNNILYINGLQPATDYVVRILPGMEDPYGNTIRDEYSFTFKNGDYSPYARLVLPWAPLIYRSNGPQEVYFEYLNLESASLSVYPLTLGEFGQLVSGDTEMSAFTPKGTPIRKWGAGGPSTRNELNRFNFKLDGNGKLEPGYYFIGVEAAPLEYSNRFYQGFVFIVATDNLTLKTTSTEALAWVVDLESGEPQRDVPVTFYDTHFNEVDVVKTDKDGLAYTDKLDSAVYAAGVAGGDHLALTSTNWGSGVSAYDFGLYENFYGPTIGPFAYLYTDRPVYRPDQDVFFKGILRQEDDLHYSLPPQKRVYVTIEYWGGELYSEYLPISDLGSFTGTFKLDREAELGTYSILARYAPGDEPFASLSFRVAEYHKPEFQVNASPDQPDVLKGERVNFELNATYYSGGSLNEADVSWYVESAPYDFNPSSDYNQYSFEDWDRDSYWYWEGGNSRSVIAEGQAVTDETGHLLIEQKTDLGESKTSQQFNFNANVTDVAGNLVSGGTSVVVHQSEYYAGIRSERYIGTQGEAQPFSVVVLDWDSTPIAGQTVTVQFVERRWYSVQKEDEQGQLQWVTSVKEIPVGQQRLVTGDDGSAQVSFTPPRGGIYKAMATVRDTKGNTHQASTYTWVSSGEYIAWGQTNDRTFSLVADKDMYEPGDTAELLIAQPFEGRVYALVTYERGHIYKQDVVLLEGNSTVYKLPITDEMAPLAYVSVTVISGAENTGEPDFKIGMTRLNVDTKRKTLDVTVTADKTSAGPNEEVTYTITTKDIDGKPVSADVSLAVVDKAVLALAPSNSASMLASFYPEKSLSVQTALGIVLNAEDFNANYRKTIPEGGGSGGGGGGDSLGIITVRENFKDTAAFRAQVTTDENGRAQVKVILPENLTTWHADVRAVTDDSRVGEATHELVSTKPVFVQLQTPRFFVAGDEVQIGAAVHNNTASTLKVNVTLEAQGVDLKSQAAQVVEIEGKQQAYVTWKVIAGDTARVDLTATAVSGAYTDSSKPALGTLSGQGIPVFNYTAVETVGTSGMLLTADSATESIQLPRSYNFTDASLAIEVSPSLAASMQTGLTYLKDYPYLCMEQTVSGFLANVITRRALEAAGIPSPLQTDLDAQVDAALQRIYAKQIYDGGWNWWDGDESDPQTSAYVVYGLLEARESGYPISETVLANGINYLKENLPDLKRNDAAWGYNRYAFMLYVLARTDELGAGQANFIFDHRTSLDLFGEAYLAQALYLLDPADERVPTLLSDLQTATVMSAAGAHWEESSTDYWNWNSDTRTTAIVLNAFVQMDPQNPITANAVRWLMAHRTGGHWYSTQETTWSLIALTNWLVASKEYETNYKYAIGLNGESLEQGQANKDNLTETVKLQVALKDLLKDEANHLVFTRGRGTGNLYYTAYLSATLPVEEIQPLDQGMSLSRQYFTLDDSKKPITEIERGELVKVRLTIVVPESVHYIVVNDPLPAGMEAIDATLATDTQVPLKYTLQDYTDRGWGWWYFSHIELRDEKVVLSADYLPAGTYVYSYLVRASTTGTFKVIPPTASEFYFPDVGGRGAGSVFTVK